jgi:hypothetical protein
MVVFICTGIVLQPYTRIKSEYTFYVHTDIYYIYIVQSTASPYINIIITVCRCSNILYKYLHFYTYMYGPCKSMTLKVAVSTTLRIDT